MRNLSATAFPAEFGGTRRPLVRLQDYAAITSSFNLQLKPTVPRKIISN
jgi:hypothetical protein